MRILLRSAGQVRWLFLTLCAALPLLAWAVPPTVDLRQASRPIELLQIGEYFIDDSAALTVQQVAARTNLPWRPMQSNVRYPIDGKALWLRFVVLTATDSPRWFLEVPYSGLDRIQFFHQDPRGAWVTEEAGDVKPVSRWPIPGKFPAFDVNPNTPPGPATYYARLEHARIGLSIQPRLTSRADFVASRDREQLRMGAYFGVVVAVALLASVLAVLWRDRLFGLFAAYVMAMGIAQMGHLGFGAQYVWTDWLAFNRLSTFSLSPLAAAVALALVRAITVPARSARWLDRLMLAVMALLPITTLLDAVLELEWLRLSVSWLMMATLVLTTLALALAWRRQDDPHMPWVALGFAPIIVMAIVPLLSMMQLIPGSWLTRNSASLGALMQLPILMLALSLKSSARREALARQGALATTDPLTGLASRQVLLLRLDSALRRNWKLQQQFGLIVVRVANLADRAPDHDHRVADRLLVLTASRLRRLAGDVDLAARVGGSEFALLMEAPTTRERVMRNVDRLLAPFLANGDLPGPEPQLQAAYAMLPRDTLNPGTVLDWMLSSQLHGRDGGGTAAIAAAAVARA